MKAQRTGQLDEAYADWQKLHQIAPESPYASYDAASGAARLGRTDEAFAWLDKAVDSGYGSPESARADEDLASLYDDPRWQPILDRMQGVSDRATQAFQARRPDPDITGAPVFKSARKLAAAYNARKEAIEDNRWRLAPASYQTQLIALSDERYAAAQRYILDHPKAKDREAAAWDAIANRAVLGYPYYLRPRWGDAGLQVIDELDAFVKA